MEFCYTVAVLVSPGKRPPLSEMINFFPFLEGSRQITQEKEEEKEKKKEREGLTKAMRRVVSMKEFSTTPTVSFMLRKDGTQAVAEQNNSQAKSAGVVEKQPNPPLLSTQKADDTLIDMD